MDEVKNHPPTVSAKNTHNVPSVMAVYVNQDNFSPIVAGEFIGLNTFIFLSAAGGGLSPEQNA